MAIKKVPVADIEKVEVGQIWELETDTIVNYKPLGENPIKGRRVLLLRGEKIEIRYPYAWHFRTEDDIYFQIDEPTLKMNCKLIGYIWSEVRGRNIAKLEEILRLKLWDDYKKVEN